MARPLKIVSLWILALLFPLSYLLDPCFLFAVWGQSSFFSTYGSRYGEPQKNLSLLSLLNYSAIQSLK